MSFSNQLLVGPASADFQQLLNLLAIPNLTDLMANGADDWWFDSGTGLQWLGNVGFNQSSLVTIARYLIELGERHLDQANPICDAAINNHQLPQLQPLGIAGIRVHAVLESAVSERTIVSIRIHRIAFPSLEDLVAEGMVSPDQEQSLREMLALRQNFLVIGPAGSGKTTLLRSLLAQPSQLRTIIIEDTAELAPVSGHFVALQVRQPNIEGAGLISLESLANQALRMRPDRLVLGEARGSEVLVLLSAMNTGHNGSAATLHANSVADVPMRLRSMVPSGTTDQSLTSMMATAIQCVIELGIDGHHRRVLSIGGLQP
ncbi:MAG: hypothetical protein RL508_1008 [Actinomycetota bacterium]|jgi:pilus assembly protein CpaF